MTASGPTLPFAVLGTTPLAEHLLARLAHRGFHPAPFDPAILALSDPAASVAAVVAQLPTPRIVWLSCDDGAVRQAFHAAFAETCDGGDVVLDVSPALFTDTMDAAQALTKRGAALVDLGIADSPWAVEHGFAISAGGQRDVLTLVAPMLDALAPRDQGGWLHAGHPGAGHFMQTLRRAMDASTLSTASDWMSAFGTQHTISPATVAQSWQQSAQVNGVMQQLAQQFLARQASFGPFQPYGPQVNFGLPATPLATGLGPAADLASTLNFAGQHAQAIMQQLGNLLRPASA